MAKFHVTLKANLKNGELYWVANVAAASEDEAMRKAEALFVAELESEAQWAFEEGDVEPL